MKRVYGLACNGQKELINASGCLYFTWKLSDCSFQKEFTLNVYDDDKIIYTVTEQSNKQLHIAENLQLIPLKEYAYDVTVVTDKYSKRSEKAILIGAIDSFKGAKWISNGSSFVEEGKTVGSPAQYFQKTITIEKVPYKSIINICGLGLYELYLNGQRVGDRVLEPAFTDYTKRVLYSTYEVSSLLNTGENLIEVVLGDGWYNQTTKDTWGFYRAPWRDCPKFIFSMSVGDEKIVSDLTWKVSKGELISNALRVGEFYDFTAEREYYNAIQVTPPGGKLVPCYLPPIKECEVINPVKIINGSGCKIYDFGKNIAGYCSVKLAGNNGDLAYFEYSDRIKNGKMDNESNSMYIFNSTYYQKDGCKLNDGINEYKPKFVYHGFRYLAIYTQAEILDVKAYFVHTDLERIGNFNSSSEKLNKLYDMSINAILSNYHGMPTDCPHREKNGWTGDAQLSLEPSIYNFDMQFAYKKWLNDFKDNQLLSGQISAIIPTCGWGFNWGSGPCWDIAFFRIPYALKKYYGDSAEVKEIYPYLEKYFDYLSGYENDGLISVGLGDWNYPKKITFDVCPLELLASCYYMLMADVLAEFSISVNPTKIEKYKAISRKTANLIIEKYSNEKSLTGMAALDYFNLVDRKNEVCKYLENNDCAVHFGIIGAKFVLEVLGKCGRTDLGLKLLERTEYPSFGYWAINGQTALCEDFELTNSLNHHMYSPIIEYMIKYLCGFEIISVNQFKLNPNLPIGLDNVSFIYKTPNGDLKISVCGETVEFNVPSNCTIEYGEKVYTYGEYKFN